MILILVVLLMAGLINYQEPDKQKALLLGSGVVAPQAYKNEQIPVFYISEYTSTTNHWNLLEEFAQQNPAIDSLIYINDYKDTDFIGAIPTLNFHLELISSAQQQISQKKEPIDTLLIHFDTLSELVKEKFDKVLKANYLYTDKKVNFKSTRLKDAQLVFTKSAQKRNVNQIVLTDTISSDYLIQKKYTYSTLYLSEKWFHNPINEDLFLSVLTEYIAEIVQPNFQYSSFDSIYARRVQAREEVKQVQAFNNELLWLIVLLMMLERYLSYRKKNA
jgi:hypothetical protein